MLTLSKSVQRLILSQFFFLANLAKDTMAPAPASQMAREPDSHSCMALQDLPEELLAHILS